MNESKSESCLAALVATHDRIDLLSKRSLPSVVGQTRRPDILVVVDDSELVSSRSANSDFVSSLAMPGCEIAYLENARSRGASGAWNTALGFLMTKVEEPARMFVAILDDDDAWCPEYLERCWVAASTRRLDMVAASLRRFGNHRKLELPIASPSELSAKDFFVGNPGIQGSNLFARLSVFLEAGMFDEALTSTTDRDICIRIADLGSVRYGRIADGLVDHHADPGRARLSVRNSESKIRGLDAFWRKYSGRMSDGQRKEFKTRASTFFGWREERNGERWPQLHTTRNGSITIHDRRSGNRSRGSLKLAEKTGVTQHEGFDPYWTGEGTERSSPTDSEPTSHPAVSVGKETEPPSHKISQHGYDDQPLRGHLLPARPFEIAPAPKTQELRLHIGVVSSDPGSLEQFLLCLGSVRGGDIRELTVVVLVNGCSSGNFEGALRAARALGLPVALVDEARQREDAARGGFGVAFGHRPPGQVGIARARTMLQRYVGEILTADPDSFGWILDDDMRVDERARAFLPWLPEFRKKGVDVLIGAYEGASPNTALHGLRVQLVDLFHNLWWLCNLPDSAALPDRREENATLRSECPDYHYDLSRRHSKHLEFPHWLEPAFPGESVGKARVRLLGGAIGLLEGRPLTRPLVAPSPNFPLETARDSVNRGGCTFILNGRALSKTPNNIVTLLGREARRSDMFWAIVNRHYRQMKIQEVGFPINHVGRTVSTSSLDIDKVREEICGSALYGGVTEFLCGRPGHQLDFSDFEVGEIFDLIKAHLANRLQALELGFHRMAGLCAAIRNVPGSDELRALIYRLGEWITRDNLESLCRGADSLDGEKVRNFLRSLRSDADDYATASVAIDFLESQLGDLRRRESCVIRPSQIRPNQDVANRRRDAQFSLNLSEGA